MSDKVVRLPRAFRWAVPELKVKARELEVMEELIREAQERFRHRLFMEVVEMVGLYQEALDAGRPSKAAEIREELLYLIGARS